MSQKTTLTQNGKEYWRSLDQLADTPEFKEFVQREFPEQASEMSNPVTRRTFLSLMGASIALAGLAGCRRPVEKIIPYVIKPEEIIPGVAEYFATVMPFGTGAYGVVAKSHEGRPTKVEGNEKHPSSLGATNAYATASVLNLYDPDRSAYVLNKGNQKLWNDFVAAWRELFAKYTANKGEGLAIVSESFASPTMARLQAEFTKAFPKATWTSYEAVSDENIYAGIEGVTGNKLQPVYNYGKAGVILSLDADFLHMESDNITASRGFADGRRMKDENDTMNRLYVVESMFTLTGGMADHRLRLQSRQIGAFTVALAKALGVDTMGINADTSVLDEKANAWIAAVAKDLTNNKSKSLIVAGRRQPAAVHALVLAINSALGNVGTTVQYHAAKDMMMSNRSGLAELTKSLSDGKVSTLVMLGGNPVYNAPADLKFAEAMKKAEHTIHFNGYVDETGSNGVEWHIPASHFLEAWGDVRSANGTVSAIQPLIDPLYATHSDIEVLYLLTTGKEARGYDIVRETWKTLFAKGVDFEKAWRLALHDGVVGDTATAPVTVKMDAKAASAFVAKNALPSGSADANNLEIVFYASSATFDGRFANNGWLQELPDPVTKITWDNAAIMSHKTAEALKVKNILGEGKNHQPMIRLKYQGQTLELPVWVQPGHADYSIAVALGYGRQSAGRVGNGVGADTYALRTSAAMDFDLGLTAEKLSKMYLIATVQDHGGFDTDALADNEIQRRIPTIIREATIEEYKKDPNFITSGRTPGEKELYGKDGKPISIMNMHEYGPERFEKGEWNKKYQWGMSIDLNACTGCNACMIACQSENNIPVVGKEEVAKGREMHWIRLDRYYIGKDVNEPEMQFQPIACQHCETAPCEQVCPVAATVHDSEGLNVMVYNRCVGTRYCANNCPYKVRRFNFLEFHAGTSGFMESKPIESLKLGKNPDVTVRMRGVMEKCTYCVQRISGARIAAKKEDRDIRDGEVVTACQQSCPTGAIVFGNINDPESKVSKMKAMNRKYEVLAELNVRPRTSFLAKLKNPNPELTKNA